MHSNPELQSLLKEQDRFISDSTIAWLSGAIASGSLSILSSFFPHPAIKIKAGIKKRININFLISYHLFANRNLKIHINLM